jgi:hypothetical protein
MNHQFFVPVDHPCQKGSNSWTGLDIPVDFEVSAQVRSSCWETASIGHGWEIHHF